MTPERLHVEDQLLVMDAQDGSAAAMDALVKRWQKRLWHHAHRLTGDREAAWDVTQSAWCDMIRRLGKLHDPASFAAWAYKITTCKAVDWIKKTQRQRSLPLDRPERIADQTQDTPELDEYLSRLTVHQRTVLCLYYFENLSIAEISEVLNIRPGTVKSRLHTARGELKKQMTTS